MTVKVNNKVSLSICMNFVDELYQSRDFRSD